MGPSESGWGLTIVRRPTDVLFAVWFVYDAPGKPTWYTLEPGQPATATRIMKEATSTTPIVYGRGLRSSAARHRGESPEAWSERDRHVESGGGIDAEASRVPRSDRSKATTVAVVCNANNPVHALGWHRVRAAAKDMNLNLMKVELRRGEDLPAAIDERWTLGPRCSSCPTIP